MKFTRLFASSAVAVLMATSAMAQDAVTADTVIATVNGTDITVGHVIALTDRLPDNVKSLPDERLYNGIVQQLIDQNSVAASINTDSRAVQLAIENETRALLATMAIAAAEDAAVTDEALQAAYDARFADFVPKQEYNAAHILVETEDEAKELVKTLEGGADFAELAKEKSTGPSGPNGGDLGWFGLGRMVPAFEQAVVGMDVGAISAPVETQFGWHVIKLNEKRDTPKPTLESVREELAQPIRDEAADLHIGKMRLTSDVKRSEVEIDPSVIRNLDLISDE